MTTSSPQASLVLSHEQKHQIISHTNAQSPRPSPVSKRLDWSFENVPPNRASIEKVQEKLSETTKQTHEKSLRCWGFLQRRELTARRDSVLFIGYAEAALGLGEVFRNMLTALDSAGMPFAIYPFSKDVETRRIGPFQESRYDLHGVYDINVALMATDQLPYYFSELQKQVTGGGYNILQTYWELAEAPLAWHPLLERIGRVVGAEFLRRKRGPVDFRSEHHSGPGLYQRKS
jgi:hypothetical protein